MRHSRLLAAATLSLLLAPSCASKSRDSVTGAPASDEPVPVQAGTKDKPITVLPHPIYATMAPAGQASIADVAERVTPSVVSVFSTKLVRQMPQVPEPFRHFFGPFGPPGLGPQGEPQREQGLGSGVVVADGVIVTNNHVVEDADEIRVTSADGKEYQVEVAGTDPKSDLAVLRVKGDSGGLRPLPMGDSSKLRPGDIVLAVGNPFGVGQTVTMGIVSAKGRADLGITDYGDFIQTDAAINPGNSGGALVSMSGELVGINTAILSRSGGYQGIGFAIPTDMARPITEALLKSGHVTRGFLGVGIQDVDKDLAAAMKLPSTQGVLVSDVGPDTPAARAGLKRGDVVLEVDGTAVDSTGRLRNLIAAAGASSTVKLKLIRDGKTITLPVTLGEMPQEEAGAEGKHGGPAQPGSEAASGLTLAPLTPEIRQRYRLDSSVTEGVLVTRVDPGSLASRAGIRPGDVVLEVNRTKVATPAAARAALEKSQKSLLLISRRGRTLFVALGK